MRRIRLSYYIVATIVGVAAAAAIAYSPKFPLLLSSLLVVKVCIIVVDWLWMVYWIKRFYGPTFTPKKLVVHMFVDDVLPPRTREIVLHAERVVQAEYEARVFAFYEAMVREARRRVQEAQTIEDEARELGDEALLQEVQMLVSYKQPDKARALIEREQERQRLMAMLSGAGEVFTDRARAAFDSGGLDALADKITGLRQLHSAEGDAVFYGVHETFLGHIAAERYKEAWGVLERARTHHRRAQYCDTLERRVMALPVSSRGSLLDQIAELRTMTGAKGRIWRIHTHPIERKLEEAEGNKRKSRHR